MVYNGYYKVMSNIPKMGHLQTPDETPHSPTSTSPGVFEVPGKGEMNLDRIKTGPTCQRSTSVMGLSMGRCMMDLPSGYVKIAIDNGHRHSGFYPLNMVIFHSYVGLPEGTTS